MILVDTSVWVDHLRRTDLRLVRLLEEQQVCVHPMVIGELALGSIARRAEVLAWLSDLPRSTSADHEEILAFVERHRLFGTGLGLVDVHLLASTLLDPGTALWTRDRGLGAAAARLGLSEQVADPVDEE